MLICLSKSISRKFTQNMQPIISSSRSSLSGTQICGIFLPPSSVAHASSLNDFPSSTPESGLHLNSLSSMCNHDNSFCFHQFINSFHSWRRLPIPWKMLPINFPRTLQPWSRIETAGRNRSRNIFSRLMLRSFRPIPVIFYRTKGRRGATAA